MKLWWQAIRPKTLFASASPVLLAQSAAWQIQGRLSWWVALGTLSCALLLQMAANLANDYHDWKSGVDGPGRTGPVRAIPAGLLSPAAVRRTFLACLALGLSLGIPLMIRGGWPIILIGFASLSGAWLYSAGPWPLSRLALGEPAALLFFGPVAVWGGVFLQTGQADLEPALLGLGPGFICAAIMGINNLRDRLPDASAGKTTLATLMGERAARFFALACVLVACAIPPCFNAWYVPLAALPFGRTWWRILKAPIDAGLNDCLAKTGMFLFAYCLLWSAQL